MKDKRKIYFKINSLKIINIFENLLPWISVGRAMNRF